jgi:hypothetical protein
LAGLGDNVPDLAMFRQESPLTIIQLIRSNADVIAALPEHNLTAMDLARYLAEQAGCPYTVAQLSRAIWRHQNVTRTLRDDRRATIAQLLAAAGPAAHGSPTTPPATRDRDDREPIPDHDAQAQADHTRLAASRRSIPPEPAAPATQSPEPAAAAARIPPMRRSGAEVPIGLSRSNAVLATGRT